MTKICIIVALIFFPCFLFGQDIHFSQTTRAKFQINPAFTGAFTGDVQATVNWKDQWQSISNTFRTYAASFETTFGKGNPKRPTFFGIGAHAFRDASGDVQIGNTNVGIDFSTLLRVSRNGRFVLGVQGNYGFTGLNTSAMQWGTQYNGINYDPSLNNGEGVEYKPYQYFDAGAGIAYWFRKNDPKVNATSAQDAKIGLAVYHINRPSYAFSVNGQSRLPMRFVGHASAILKTRWENLYWYPNLTTVLQGKQHEILVGSLWKYRLRSSSKSTGFISEVSASGGIDVRITNVVDAIVPQIYIEMFNFAVGVSYDVNVSHLWNASHFRGGMEISLRFTHPDAYIHKNPFRYVPSI